MFFDRSIEDVADRHSSCLLLVLPCMVCVHSSNHLTARRLANWPCGVSIGDDVSACTYIHTRPQVLLYLKEFSQKMVTRTTAIEKQVDTLVHEAKVSSVSSLSVVLAQLCLKMW